MLRTTFEDFSERAGSGNVIPVAREFSTDTLTPVVAYAAVARPPFAFLLESLVGGERWARYTFLGTEPREAWQYRAGRVERWTSKTGWRDAGEARDPLQHIGELMRSKKPVVPPGLPSFVGGAVGYLGYDVVRAFEHLPDSPSDDLGVPDAMFIIADSLVIIDNAFARAILVTNAFVEEGASADERRQAFDRAEARNTELLVRLNRPPQLHQLSIDGEAQLTPTTPYQRDTYERDVDRVRGYIRAGDAFQVVLSRRQDVPSPAPPFDVYRALRMLNPAPYLYFLNLDKLALVGSSPEVLVRVENGAITVRPIAGTRPRGKTEADDRRLAEELLADPKELAEHAMLVDLGRNDVGRVSEFGSVRVTVDKEIERYSHVQHIVSQVEGRLRRDFDAVDALRACFPAGTVSGAPKVRAMEIIDELEPTRRGPYAGAVCYLGWGGKSMDTAITIRTALLKDGIAHIQSGGGIVADSVPAQEFEETENKAGAVLRAIRIAAGSISQG